MKDTLIKCTNYRKTIEWMKSRIKSMIWNIRKQKTTNQNNKNKESKKMSIVDEAPGSTSSVPTFSS